MKKVKEIKQVKIVLLGVVLTILIVSAALNIYYYNLSLALTKRVQGATLEAAGGFQFGLVHAANILESDAKPENIRTLVSDFNFHIHSATMYLRALRMYLLPSYEESLLVIEDLLWNITVQGLGGVSDTFAGLSTEMRVDAFKELNIVASEKIFDMGLEVAGAFTSHRRNHVVQTFEIIPSRLENAVLIANDLESILNEWITKYSQV
ncbi:MAG: hypothetical protein JSV15_03730 [Candidatus Bathyarchaeota archaeon]|nr:MAG: hypothetical protein JSV15_03730 [Candidatus Bathyarchaeota archaeon]